MRQVHGVYQFTTTKIIDNEAGYFGLELHRSHDGESQTIAKIIFWDAEGQFSVETLGEVPLTILEELILEARNTDQ